VIVSELIRFLETVEGFAEIMSLSVEGTSMKASLCGEKIVTMGKWLL
jgi:hypothetical protein